MMGIFDSVYVDCPHCGKPVEFQTKVGDPYMNRFTLETASDEMLRDIMDYPEHCMSCDGWLTLVDPERPLEPPPRPVIKVARVRTPENPRTHPQGMKWWPDSVPFTRDDLQ